MGAMRRSFVAVAVLLLLAIGSYFLALNTAHRTRVLTFDSIVYLDTARQVAAGRGLTTRILRPNDTAVEPAQTQWPPLYSLTVAPLIASGVDPVTAGRVVSAAAFGLVVLLVGLWLWRTAGLGAGLGGSALLGTIPAVTGVAAAVWSDALYTVFVTALAWLGASLAARPGRLRWFIVGIIVGAAVLTKYLGLTLFGIVALLLLAELRRRGNARETARHALLALVGVALVVVPLIVRNLATHRPLGGAVRHASSQSFPTVATDTIQTIGKDALASWPLMTLVGLVVVGALITWRRRPRLNDGRDALTAPLGSSVVVVGAFLLGLILARSVVDTDPIYSRFVAPVFPALVVALVLLAYRGLRIFHRSAPVFAMTLLAAVSVGLAVKSYDFGAGTYSEPETARIAWIREQTTPRDLLVGDHAPEYTLFLGRTSLYLAGDQYADRLSPDMLDALALRWRGQFDRVLLTLTPNLDAGRYGDYAAALSANTIDSWGPAAFSSKLIVYDLAQR